MGTINYKTSDYITIGYNCNNIDYDDEFYNDFISDCYNQIAARLKQEYFYYFHIAIELGYYEGFSIDIEFNFGYCFDNWNDRRNTQKEITRIKQFLIECVNNYECNAVFPGWCTRYLDYTETLKALNDAIKEMRNTVKNTPVWSRLPIGER